MDVLCTFKNKIESQNSEYWCTNGQWPYPNQYQDAKPQSGTSSVLQSPKSGLKGHGCSLHLQIKMERQNSDSGCTKVQWPYPNKGEDAKPKSETSRVLVSPKSGIKGHWFSLRLQNQDREPKLRAWVHQRPVTISKLRSRCQTPAKKAQSPPKPQIRT